MIRTERENARYQFILENHAVEHLGEYVLPMEYEQNKKFVKRNPLLKDYQLGRRFSISFGDNFKDYIKSKFSQLHRCVPNGIKEIRNQKYLMVVDETKFVDPLNKHCCKKKLGKYCKM